MKQSARRMYKNVETKHAFLGVLLVGGFSALFFATPHIFSTTYKTNADDVASAATSTPENQIGSRFHARHISTPKPLRAIYMSQCVVGTPSFREKLVNLIDETELNAVVIDIKDYTGKISFPTENPALKDSVSDACGARDMQEFIAMLHEKGIYVIGRVTTFQDPYYTKLHPEQSVQSRSRPGEPWKDFKGLSFISVASKPYWEYVVALSKESYAIGFDEINYDYVRWPSDGPMSDVDYPAGDKAVALEKFFAYLRDSLQGTGIVMSADLFGMTTTNTDDLNIGQQLERALPYFDYIAPMVYPSHYPKNFNGYADVNQHPYDIIKFSMQGAIDRVRATSTPVASLGAERIGTTTPALYTKKVYDSSVLRPWLQDFDYPVPYTPEMVRAQMQAAYDIGLDSWMLWDPGNTYTRSALHDATE